MAKSLTINELRSAYREFFTGRGHTAYRSASLIPENDPTILFTVAGMAQFKDMFLGRGTHEFTRATTCQKVVRTNDIMEVGRTPRHHTFFEMLGNFSFNDYFKREAITWAWEFLTDVLELEEARLSISVHETDDEAYDMWTKEVGVPAERVFRMGDADNFWPANAPADGPNGPGGYCSEIFWDFQTNDDPADNLTTGSDRFVEIWNLVFPQFNVCEPRVDGRLTLDNLGRTNIDTGMGLERMACVLQGKCNTFDTDLFQSIIADVIKISGARYVEGATVERDGAEQCAMNTLLRRIADHVRAITFCIVDGALPSNTGRGYVVRRLIRRATLDSNKLGLTESRLYEVVGAVVQNMGEAYPDLVRRRDLVEQTLKAEEESFRKTLSRGLDMLQRGIVAHKQAQKIVFSGDDAFELFTTHGFPRELIDEILEPEGLQVDEEQYQARWAAFVAVSHSKTIDVFTSSALQEAKPRLGATPFIGYDDLEQTVTITLLEHDGKEVEEAEAGAVVRIALDKTPFYAESGGQVGDVGTLVGTDSEGHRFEVSVTDTQKDEGLVVHIGTVLSGTAQPVGVRACVDKETRASTTKHHSATHLLHSALCSVVGDHVEQQGSKNDPEMLRFDYNNPGAPKKQQLQEVQAWVQQRIAEKHAVTTVEMDIEAARVAGAKAQFGEKYGDAVRVVTMGSADVSIELCGGCHVRNTEEIGAFRIIKDEASAAGIRRIVAVVGAAAEELQGEEQRIIDACAHVFGMDAGNTEDVPALVALYKASGDELVDRVQKQVAQLRAAEAAVDATETALEGSVLERIEASQKAVKSLQRRKEEQQAQAAVAAIDDILSTGQTLAGVQVFTARLDGVDGKALRQVADVIKQKEPEHIAVLAAGPAHSEKGGKALLAVSVGESCVKKGVKAGALVGQLAKIIGGGGGGKPDYAQAGGKKPEQIDAALAEAKVVIENLLSAESSVS